MATHIDGPNVIFPGEMWGNVIECVSHASDAVQHDERRLPFASPIEIVDAQTIHGNKPVCTAWRLPTLQHNHEKRKANTEFHLFCSGLFNAKTNMPLPELGRRISGASSNGISVDQLPPPRPVGMATYCLPLAR